jgi:acyl-CoA dehydrogenase
MAKVEFQRLREQIRAFCAAFPDAHWRELDAKRVYPQEFVAALTRAGWLAALIPKQYGGLGLSLAEASVILEEVNRSGGNAGPAHAQMYVIGRSSTAGTRSAF